MRIVVPTSCLALLLVSAAPPLSPEDLLRQGQTAFAREEYEAALHLYSKAEETTTDPSLVSFHKGTALYRLGRHREAQLHFERCLEESEPTQRPALYYNLGNCLLHQAQAGGDLALFREAGMAYQRCLDQPSLDAALQEKARYNLELTKLLWLQARLSRPEQEPPPGAEPPPETPPKGQNQPDQNKTENSSEPRPSHQPHPSDAKEKHGKLDEKKGKQTPVEIDVTTPGQGNLQPPRDEAHLHPLAPEDALRHLEAAAERIRRERKAYMLRIAPIPSRSVPDW